MNTTLIAAAEPCLKSAFDGEDHRLYQPRSTTKSLRAFLTLAAAFGIGTIGTLSAAPVHLCDKAMAYQVSEVKTDVEPYYIERGATVPEVRRQLGNPDDVLAPNVWVYFGIWTDYAPANEAECSSLVITIDNDRVSDIKFANCRARAVIVAHKDDKIPFTVVAQK